MWTRTCMTKRAVAFSEEPRSGLCCTIIEVYFHFTWNNKFNWGELIPHCTVSGFLVKPRRGKNVTKQWKSTTTTADKKVKGVKLLHVDVSSAFAYKWSSQAGVKTVYVTLGPSLRFKSDQLRTIWIFRVFYHHHFQLKIWQQQNKLEGWKVGRLERFHQL